MPGLRELQLEFTAALFDGLGHAGAPSDLPAGSPRSSLSNSPGNSSGDGPGSQPSNPPAESLLALVRADGIAAAERLDIYRNNLREGFIKALATGFPVIERLVGADYFRQLAIEFLQAHPSRAGNLHHIGKPFAPFLNGRFANTPYRYFTDVAALEWAHQCALIAPEPEPQQSPLGADAFRDIAPEDYERLVFEFHPACGFVDTSCPVVRIWRANQPESLSDETIDVSSAADKVLVLRTPECVEFHTLPASRFELFAALGRGECLGVALETVQAIEPDFDLGAALRHLLDLNILVRLRTAA